MKVALVQDWLTEMGGAEKVFSSIYDLFLDADIFTLVYKPEIVKKMNIDEKKITASFIQKMPFAKTKYRNYLPFFTYAIESFDLSKYDLIISSSYSVAKGVLTHSNQIHICYCHSPVRYAWDLYHQYIKETKLKKGIKGMVVKYYLHKLRIWDIISINRVDYFISNSNYIKNRIRKIYHQDAITIYPPVDIKSFECIEVKEDFYLTCSRLVPYKKIDLIVKTFSKMPDKKLIVIGDGPDMNKIKDLAKSNVQILGYQPFSVLKDHLQRAKAFVFAAEEDFGIVPIEAQASGTPVIAFQKGGVIETVIDKKTGIFFKEQTIESLQQAIDYFEDNQHIFSAKEIRLHAEVFDVEVFKNKFSNFVLSKTSK